MKAVVFDVGGVLLSSPLASIRAFEKAKSLAAGFFLRPIRDGRAFKDLEAGAITRSQFATAFADECEALRGVRIDGEEWLSYLEANFQPQPVMLEALERVRRMGLLVAILTNNWEGPSFPSLLKLSAPPDVLIESYRVKTRKPDEEIYRLCLRELQKKNAQIRPEHIVFLDDISGNCKAAAKLGWNTIIVEKGKENDAVALLGEILTSSDTLGKSRL